MTKVQRTISLDVETSRIADKTGNLSAFVRTALRAWASEDDDGGVRLVMRLDAMERQIKTWQDFTGFESALDIAPGRHDLPGRPD